MACSLPPGALPEPGDPCVPYDPNWLATLGPLIQVHALPRPTVVIPVPLPPHAASHHADDIIKTGAIRCSAYFIPTYSFAWLAGPAKDRAYFASFAANSTSAL